ncbi:M20 family metallopeptidase [Persicobacter sp. CCB-QB2]|uniref:M20 metallopeptidase family protein n=1 Tax=Persicobacter sp. CCB-QB2 TaxID=1561025 RepID=UPI0006A99240|nr:M20 family metallopeptidase [Persicobacter sp. CCB-QB2]
MKTKALALKDYIIDIRRKIHANPELGYQEYETANLVAGELRKLGLEPQMEVAKTGVVAEFRKGAGPLIALRADMDALPIQEATGLPFASQIPNVSHACGHDAHTAMLLGAAKILKEEEFEGGIRLIFQPAEENNYDDPDRFSGGERMVKENVMEGVDYAVALHQVPMMPSGMMSLTDGPVMAAADVFTIVVEGRASHGGLSPEMGVDAVFIAAQIINNLQAIVARNISPTESGVVSIGTIEGGFAPNVIADKVVLRGTCRALSQESMAYIRERIQTIIQQTAGMHGAKASYEITQHYDVTENHPTPTKVGRAVAKELLGEQAIIALGPNMGAEDFSFMAQVVPSVFGLLGTQIMPEVSYSLHHPRMNLNEDMLPLGTAWLAQTALELMKG